jgi:hypothetical protein
MSLTEFKQYIINLDKHNIQLYQIKKELIIYIAKETINMLYKEKENVDVLHIYNNLQSLKIEDIISMSKIEDLSKCANRYLRFLNQI